MYTLSVVNLSGLADSAEVAGYFPALDTLL